MSTLKRKRSSPKNAKRVNKQKALKKQIESLIDEYNIQQEQLNPRSKIMIFDSIHRLCNAHRRLCHGAHYCLLKFI